METSIKWRTMILVTLNLLGYTQSLDVKKQKEPYVPDYTYYHNLSRIKSHVVQIAQKHPDIVRVDWSFVSRDNRPQLLLHVTDREVKVAKVKVLLSFGEHAREFLPVESMFHLLTNLTLGLQGEQFSPEESYSRFVLSRFELFIIVMANPDGRNVVETTHNYCWRGTSSGVDLNRNFDWEFGNLGSSDDPNDEEYRGQFVFSEIESKIYRTLTRRHNFDAFISFHSGIRQIYLPFADTVSKRTKREPRNVDTLKRLARQLSLSTRHNYTYGTAYDLNVYTADGTVLDYIAGKTQVSISMAIELWGNVNHKGWSCFDQFNPHSLNLQREVSSLHPLYVTLFKFLIAWKKHQPVPSSDISEEVPSLYFCYVLLCVVVATTVFVVLKRKWWPCSKVLSRRRIVSLKSLSSSLTVWGFKRL